MAVPASNRHEPRRDGRRDDTSAGQGRSDDATPASATTAGLTATEFASAVTAISSAFGDPTRRDVFLQVHESGEGVTAAEVAARFRLHVNVARHHLDKLAAGGYVEAVVDRAPGSGAGRPSKRYRAATPELPAPLPIRHDAVVLELLNRSLALLPPEQAEALAEQVGEEHGRALAASMGDLADAQRSIRAALHLVADAMTAHGFDARVDPKPGELRIVAGHCPFGGAPIAHPILCAVDRGMVKGMLAALYGESSPHLESSQLDGSDTCTTKVEVGHVGAGGAGASTHPPDPPA